MADRSTLLASLSDTLAHPIDALPVNVGSAERLISTALGAALVGVGLSRKSGGGALLAAAGGVLAFRGTTGYCPAYGALGHSSAHPAGVTLETALTINRPRAEVYAAWRRLETLEAAMKHVEAIDDLGGGRSRWTASGPGEHGTLTWVAEETNAVQDREVSWRTVEGDVEHTGRVRFDDAPAGRGTEVRVEWRYVAPPGTGAAARFVTPALESMIRGDLNRFRALLEAGEVPTIEGQPKGD